MCPESYHWEHTTAWSFLTALHLVRRTRPRRLYSDVVRWKLHITIPSTLHEGEKKQIIYETAKQNTKKKLFPLSLALTYLPHTLNALIHIPALLCYIPENNNLKEGKKLDFPSYAISTRKTFEFLLSTFSRVPSMWEVYTLYAFTSRIAHARYELSAWTLRV